MKVIVSQEIKTVCPEFVGACVEADAGVPECGVHTGTAEEVLSERRRYIFRVSYLIIQKMPYFFLFWKIFLNFA